MPIGDKKIITFAKDISDLADKPVGYSSAQIKAQFDAAPNELREVFNGLIDLLLGITAGDSGADNIGATALNEQSGTKVQSILEYLMTQIQGAALGQIPDGSIATSKYADGSITAAKIAPDVASKQDVNSLAYDLYQFWLDQYYLGEASGSPSTAGAKAVAFDGFINTNAINTGQTTAIVDTTNKLVKAREGVVSTTKPISASNTVITGFNDTADFTNIANVVDNNSGTSASISLTTTQQITVVYDLGSSKLLKGFRHQVSSNTTASKANNIATSVDGITYTIHNIQSAVFSASTAWVEQILAAPITCRYIAVEYQLGPSGNANLYEAEAQVLDSLFLASTLKSATRSVSFTVKRVKGWISTKNDSAITKKVSFDGTNFVTGTVISSRSDPKFAGYTEYEIDFVGEGNSIVFEADFTPATATSPMPEVKRYGLHFYDV